MFNLSGSSFNRSNHIKIMFEVIHWWKKNINNSFSASTHKAVLITSTSYKGSLSSVSSVLLFFRFYDLFSSGSVILVFYFLRRLQDVSVDQYHTGQVMVSSKCSSSGNSSKNFFLLFVAHSLLQLQAVNPTAIVNQWVNYRESETDVPGSISICSFSIYCFIIPF